LVSNSDGSDLEVDNDNTPLLEDWLNTSNDLKERRRERERKKDKRGGTIEEGMRKARRESGRRERTRQTMEHKIERSSTSSEPNKEWALSDVNEAEESSSSFSFSLRSECLCLAFSKLC
jgi:hypothetical protein